MKKYYLGFDFGTLSCRGVLMDSDDGKVIATAESKYEHGVIEKSLHHKSIPLPDEWYLQDPDDWINSMTNVCHELIEASGVDKSDIVSLGTDFTSCTLIPTDKGGKPLCLYSEYRDIPNAWPKLWKHHGAQKYAEIIEDIAKKDSTWLKEYFGNSVSCEWAYPKMMQVAIENPEIYQATEYFIEAVDWIVLKLTNNLVRTSGILGVNSFYIEGKGFPPSSFSKQLCPLMEDVAETKLAGKIGKVGDFAGTLTADMAERLGLTTDVVVSTGHSDGAISGCGAGVTQSGSMMLVLGTSTCHQMMYKDFHSFDGICSVAADGMIPGLYGYESGQSATGDIFSWFASNMVPQEYYEEAEKQHKSILEYLGELADKIEPGETGLVALDWLNGNRSILSDYNLSGLIVGLTLQTKTEEVYRALVEANIFGSKRILDNYEENGVHIDNIYAVGGIAKKSPWIMQMSADVYNRKVIVPMIDNVMAVGAAVCGAVALGEPYGCKTFDDASEKLFEKDPVIYYPNEKKNKMYMKVYKIYKGLHDIFGRETDVMKELKSISAEESYN